MLVRPPIAFRLRFLGLLSAIVALTAACGLGTTGPGDKTLLVGAVYPLSGSQGEGGRQELAGLRTALELAGGRQVKLQVEPVQTPAGAQAAVDRLIDRSHVSIIVGTYGSTLAEAAAARADERHVIYWETGAVADLVTQHRRYVLRTVATGSSLGRIAVDFTGRVLLPAAGLQPTQARAVIVNVSDVYGRAVADGEEQLAAATGIPVVSRIQYDPNAYSSADIAQQVWASHADYLWDVSYIADGIDIWQAILARGVKLRAAVGTSSAFCMAAFGRSLGAQAVGVFAADKPDDQVNTEALSPAARELLGRAKAAYAKQQLGSEMPIPALAGFVGGWTLFHEVLPAAKGQVTPDAVRNAAYQLDEPAGTSINGGGVKFAGPGEPDAGQNLRAPAVVGQWQAVNTMRVVYPAAFARAKPLMP
ncbi:MAG: ABC transporter substrate-binding protein [Candidatus Dormibacteraeota bacterium]|uniref:ABC transporter substrate-binding protein n=1 Tax=Candidatus Dormiibacter inghamiae TaxID=3127013 RepID=A0A934NDJ7_9BACT|nr:ABC transporter substrate-binding protein [Candidatus Dormibacteraeota bacterium]MBJ7607696.1 ABC transporter substrate-binding protein [Candidatus Dormibacteraeota bacterium]